MKAMFKRSYEEADRIFSRIREYGSIEKDIAIMIFTKKLDPNLASVLRLIDTSRSILEYSQNIAEVTLNRIIEEIISPVS